MTDHPAEPGHGDHDHDNPGHGTHAEDAHGDDRPADKVDLPAWGAGALGVALGIAVVIALVLATGGLH